MVPWRFTNIYLNYYKRDKLITFNLGITFANTTYSCSQDSYVYSTSACFAILHMDYLTFYVGLKGLKGQLQHTASLTRTQRNKQQKKTFKKKVGKTFIEHHTIQDVTKNVLR